MHDYVTKDCFLCGPEQKLQDLYPRNFQDADLTPAVFSARRVTEHWHYHMVRCDCGLVFSRETLGDAALYDLYSESTVTFSEHISTIRKDYWRPLENHRAQLKGQAALEVGCSSGFFLEELLEQGISDVTGFEPSRSAKETAGPQVRDQIRTEFFEGASSVGDKRFGLVCSFQTLDHLSNPLDFLRKCREVVQPGGLIYLITHNVNSLQAKVLGEKSPIIDVEHIYLFNKATLSAIVEKAGFETLETRSFRNSYPLQYWAKMFPLPKNLKKLTLSALETTGLSDFSPSIHAGNICVIGRAQ